MCGFRVPERSTRFYVQQLVGYFGSKGPLRRYFSLHRAVYRKEREREMTGESKKYPNHTELFIIVTASTVTPPPTHTHPSIIQIESPGIDSYPAVLPDQSTPTWALSMTDQHDGSYCSDNTHKARLKQIVEDSCGINSTIITVVFWARLFKTNDVNS